MAFADPVSAENGRISGHAPAVSGVRRRMPVLDAARTGAAISVSADQLDDTFVSASAVIA